MVSNTLMHREFTSSYTAKFVIEKEAGFDCRKAGDSAAEVLCFSNCEIKISE